MRLQHCYALTAALAMNLLAVAAQSAPIGNPANLVASVDDYRGSIAKIAYRHCWQQTGRRHCHWYRGASLAYVGAGHYRSDADALPFGSAAWWRQMLRENRVRN
jgi:hypothetical protein